MLELAPVDAYAAILNWYQSNVPEMKRIYQRKDKYSKLSKRLISDLPEPSEATDRDMKFVARQVLNGLLEWGYHQQDDAGVPMHRYARTILGEESLSAIGSPQYKKLKQIKRLRKHYFGL